MPLVSVVMSVHNGSTALCTTVESVLSQKDVELEFVVVDDGSTDESFEILDAYANADSRLRVIRQSHLGLTAALIHGCSCVRGDFIARQDVGDLSLPGRLSRQLGKFLENPAIVLVSCSTSFVGPQGEPLFDVIQSQSDAVAGLKASDVNSLRGPSHHGATMFRRQAYLDVGGYRSAFFMAQDVDLWVRLAELGYVDVIPDLLYQAEYSLDGISAGRQGIRQYLSEMIVDAASLRRSGLSDAPILDTLQALFADGLPQKICRGESAYFIASMILKSSPKQARKYFAMALRDNPMHLKAWLRLLQLLGAKG